MLPFAFSRLESPARLRVSGPDVAVFLQGQFTNDLGRSGPGAAVYGLWLNHKGRALADSFVLRHGEAEFEVVSVDSPAAIIRERLEAFIVADDVGVEDRSAGAAGWVLAGEGAPAVVAELAGDAPGVGCFVAKDGALVFRGRAAGGANWIVLAEAAEAPAWQARLAAAAAEAGGREVAPADMAAARVASGLPAVPAELGPDDLPGEGGLEHEAISYTKGCYLGQEVMARLRNLGQVRRRLFVVRMAGGGETAAFERRPLVAGDGRKMGELRCLYRDASGGRIGLAMLALAHVEPGMILKDAAGTEFEVVELASGRAW